MRLTLRTMLAYLDDVLDPADAQELAAKIEESSVAADLIKRIQKSTRNAGVSAPPLDGPGAAIDANTAAEYLDSTLAPERMSEVDVVCMESDSYLAEIASCHQILALVLGQPLELEPSLRERIYGIPEIAASPPPFIENDQDAESGAAETGHNETGHNETGQNEKVPATGDIGAGAREGAQEGGGGKIAAPPKNREVPAYLRGGDGGVRSLPMVLTIVVGFLVAAVGLRILGPFDSRHPLLRSMFGDDAPVAVNEQPEVAPAPEKEAVEENLEGEPASANEGAGAHSENETSETPESKAGAETLPPAADIPETATAPEDTAPEVPVPESPSAAGPAEPEPKSSPQPAAPFGVGDTPNAPTPAKPPAKPAQPAGNGAGESSSSTSEAIDLGRYLSDGQVAARFDKAASAWMRLPVRAVIRAGDLIWTPPANRAKFLIGGVQVTLEGGAQVVFEKGPADNIPRIRVDYGRGKVFPLADEKATVFLDLGGRSGLAEFENADSIFGFEVWKLLNAGEDPELAAVKQMVGLYATLGAVVWQEEDGQAVTLDATHFRFYAGEAEGKTAALAKLPEWVEGGDVRDIDRRAAATMEAMVAFDQPVRISLNEAAEDRRSEVRSLAVRSLCQLGDFEALVNVFKDDLQHASWRFHVYAAREAMARDPATAAAIRQTWERRHGKEDGQRLYRLLWGYSPDQLKEEAPKLVKLLEHEMIEFRALAFVNLQEITGATQGYRAEKTAARRRSAVSRWKTMLEKGEIVPR